MWNHTSACLTALAIVAPPQPPPPRADTVRPAAADKKPTTSVAPDWARDARWYQVDVSREPAGLAGVVGRLAYLKNLGADTLYLTSLFDKATGGRRSGFLHVSLPDGADPVGPKPKATADLSPRPRRDANALNAGDRTLVRLIREAHTRGFRVVAGVHAGAFGLSTPGRDAAKAGSALAVWIKAARRWTDPNGDGRPEDGLDGWVVVDPAVRPAAFWKKWRDALSELSRDVLLIADGRLHDAGKADGVFHGFVNRRAAEVIARFFAPTMATPRPEPFLAALERVAKQHDLNTLLVSPLPLADPRTGRLPPVDGLDHPSVPAVPGGSNEPDKRSATQAGLWDRQRLAAVFQQFFPGPPLWWHDKSAGGAGSGRRYRDSLAAVIAWTSVRRTTDEPLRRGGFRRVLMDRDRSLLAVARTQPGNEVVLVVNYGVGRHEIRVPVGRPGQLIAMLNPGFEAGSLKARPAGGDKKTADAVPSLLMGASRQIIGGDGTVRVHIGPMSARVILWQAR